MKKVCFVVFLILGTVIGSGFSTGKEIVVFFTRFGYYSFLFIPLAFVLFYFTFYFLMTKGLKKLNNKKKSKIIPILMIVCATIFSSSMFAGIENCALSANAIFEVVLIFLIFVLCFFSCYKKLNFLSVINLVLVPILLAILFVFFIFKFPQSSFVSFDNPSVFIGLFGGGFYLILYVVLNISLSSVVIAKSGEGLTKKQIRLASFISAFVLSAFILLINILVVCNYDLINSAMPLLALSDGKFTFLLRFVIMVGCLTTLLSMVYVASSSCKELKIGDRSVFIICVIMPYLLSKIGFSSIVSFLYPLASYLGIFLLVLLFFRKAT